jgi:hypothetical protein
MLGFLVLVVVAVASVGSYLVWNRSIGENTNSLSLTSGVQSSVSTTSVQTTSTTSVSYPPVQWITVGKIQPLGYYLTLLQSNGTQPYVQLAKEIQKLPDYSNVTAVAEIAYLALNASNPEVKEVFELMLQGGTPDPSDFQYPVPQYNTELQVLYWLACQNQFKKDDTLALAIAMDNGIWVTIGDNQVVEAVRNDTSSLLVFFRETNEIQQQKGYYQLENYPLEAKIVLGWTGGESPDVAKSHALSLFLTKKLDLKSYQWDFTSIDTYEKMRTFMANQTVLLLPTPWYYGTVRNGTLLTKSAFETLRNTYAYFQYDAPHWVYTLHGGPSQTITVDGENMSNWEYGSTNYCFAQFLSSGTVYGVSYDHVSFIDTLLQSVGIASTHVWLTSSHKPPGQSFNDFNLVYVPEAGVWKATPESFKNAASVGTTLGYGALNESHLILFKPPVDQRGYLTGIALDREKYSTYCPNTDFCDMLFPEYSAAYTSILGSSYEKGIAFDEMKNDVTSGLPSSQMKEWLLYSGPTGRVY